MNSLLLTLHLWIEFLRAPFCRSAVSDKSIKHFLLLLVAAAGRLFHDTVSGKKSGGVFVLFAGFCSHTSLPCAAFYDKV